MGSLIRAAFRSIDTHRHRRPLLIIVLARLDRVLTGDRRRSLAFVRRCALSRASAFDDMPRVHAAFCPMRDHDRVVPDSSSLPNSSGGPRLRGNRLAGRPGPRNHRGSPRQAVAPRADGAAPGARRNFWNTYSPSSPSRAALNGMMFLLLGRPARTVRPESLGSPMSR